MIILIHLCHLHLLQTVNAEITNLQLLCFNHTLFFIVPFHPTMSRLRKDTPFSTVPSRQRYDLNNNQNSHTLSNNTNSTNATSISNNSSKNSTSNNNNNNNNNRFLYPFFSYVYCGLVINRFETSKNHVSFSIQVGCGIQ